MNTHTHTHTHTHKVLVFSQFVRVLDLLEQYVRAKGFPCERIDGAVRGNMRQSAIDRFAIYIYMRAHRRRSERQHAAECD